MMGLILFKNTNHRVKYQNLDTATKQKYPTLNIPAFISKSAVYY